MGRNIVGHGRRPAGEGEFSSTPSGVNGRGAVTNATGRFEAQHRVLTDDGWGALDDELPVLKTSVGIDATRTIIARNDSPDIPFDRSINPYRGCEHGCIYCFARPTHAYLGLSAGQDFEAWAAFSADPETMEHLGGAVGRSVAWPAPLAELRVDAWGQSAEQWRAGRAQR
jgi:hypothetical protein